MPLLSIYYRILYYIPTLYTIDYNVNSISSSR